jgi:hypothetical protein
MKKWLLSIVWALIVYGLGLLLYLMATHFFNIFLMIFENAIFLAVFCFLVCIIKELLDSKDNNERTW